MIDKIQAFPPAALFGFPIFTSPYVPKYERYEVDYSRPLIARLVHGRTVDIRVWEEDQIFLIGGDFVTRPEMCGVIRGSL